jgi:hypothetical protein
MSNNNSSIKGKDWVYNAFWAACGDRNAPCSINIPITFIFRNGIPVKALTTDELGYLKRIDLENIILERNIKDKGFRGQEFRDLNIIRKLLIEFRDVNGYEILDKQSDEDIIICKVTIKIGQK